MATEAQILNRASGGSRTLRVHRAILAIAAGVVGVTGSGSITGGSGGATGTYPLVLTGGVVATGGANAAGTYTVSGGAVTAINVTSPGQYSTAPTGFSFAASGVTAASATPSTAQVAQITFPIQAENASFPAGAYITTLKAFTASAFTGSPTNAYISIGATFGGQDYVAQTDAKAQGELTLTKVGSGIAALRNLATQIVVTLLINGGANAVAGQVEVELHYCAANP